MDIRNSDIKESIKKSVEDLVSQAKISAKTMNTGVVIPECDAYAMSYLLGYVAEARGAAAILTNIYKGDKEIYKLFKDATDAHASAYKARDRFTSECICKRK
jgi:hypothetical protein